MLTYSLAIGSFKLNLRNYKLRSARNVCFRQFIGTYSIDPEPERSRNFKGNHNSLFYPMDEIHVQTNYSLHVTYEVPHGSLDLKCLCHSQLLTSTPYLVQTLLTESADQPRVFAFLFRFINKY